MLETEVTVVDLMDIVMNSHTEKYPGFSDAIKEFWKPISKEIGIGKKGGSYSKYKYKEVDSGTPCRSASTKRRHNETEVKSGTNPIVGNLLNWDNFKTGLIQGSFSKVNGNNNTKNDARTAAEFINKLVSDHLPIVFKFHF